MHPKPFNPEARPYETHCGIDMKHAEILKPDPSTLNPSTLKPTLMKQIVKNMLRYLNPSP